MQNKPDPQNRPERRKTPRIKKSFILQYHVEGKPHEAYEATQLKNISRGGICFITSKKFPPSTKLIIKLKTPYLAEITHLEGIVQDSHEKIKNIIYETRLIFDNLSPQAEFLISRIEEIFKKQIDNDLHF